MTGGHSEALLDDLRATITTYVVFADTHAANAVALWITATHAIPAFECAPRLVITSPQKRCAKSRLLDVIAGTCHDPLATASATVAAIFRSIGGSDHPPTLIIDEADTLFGSKRAAEQNEDLRALLNAGHQRGRPALRCVGPMQIPTAFNTFSMAALAGIGAMPDTITDRAINITMRRRASGETVSQFRARRDGPILETLRTRLAAWAMSNIDSLAGAQPEMPVEDRAADTWEPLIAIADAAGGHWPTTARAACTALTATADEADEDSSDIRLLTDIRQVFTDAGTTFMPSASLVAELRRIEESPWDGWDLNPSKLGHRLRKFGIRTGHNTEKSKRGYRLEDFIDSFERYTRPKASEPSAAQVSDTFHPDALCAPDALRCPDEKRRPAKNMPPAGTRTPRTPSDGVPSENRPSDADAYQLELDDALAALSANGINVSIVDSASKPRTRK